MTITAAEQVGQAALSGFVQYENEIADLKRQLEEANRCRIALVTQIHELADHIERASGCITDIDMLKQINGQREFAIGVAEKWNQNGNPFAAIAGTKGGA